MPLGPSDEIRVRRKTVSEATRFFLPLPPPPAAAKIRADQPEVS